MVSSRAGDFSSRRRGAGLELDNIGVYPLGDDIRHMDWHATARIGRPQVKQFRHDVQQTILLAIDLRPSMMFGTNGQLLAKTARLAAARIAWSTLKNHQPLSVLLIKGTGLATLSPPRRGRRARLQCLGQMVEAYRASIAYAAQPSRPLADLFEELPSHMSGDVEVIIVSDFSGLDDDFGRHLRASEARGSVSAVVIDDALMRTAPPPGLYPLRHGVDRALTTVAFRNGDANFYRTHAERHRRGLSAHLVQLDMDRVMVTDA